MTRNFQVCGKTHPPSIPCGIKKDIPRETQHQMTQKVKDNGVKCRSGERQQPPRGGVIPKVAFLFPIPDPRGDAQAEPRPGGEAGRPSAQFRPCLDLALPQGRR